MKFFHLSDLHIGLKLFNRDLREDQEYILRQITDIAVREQPEAVVIAGDIYDKAVPSAESVEVFDRFIAGLNAALPDTAVMMIAGNHDSGPRINCFRSVLSRQNVYMIGQPPRVEGEQIEKVVLEDEFGPVNFYLLPFVRPSMVKQLTGVDENGNNLSYDETLRRLIGREKSILLREMCSSAISSIFLRGHMRRMWSVWIRKYGPWEISTRYPRILWSGLTMRRWDIFTSL